MIAAASKTATCTTTYGLSLGDSVNFTITIVIKTSQVPIIPDFVITWKSTALLQFKVYLATTLQTIAYYNYYVCYLNFSQLVVLKLSAFSSQTVTKYLFS